jgi:hypothetical protein
MKRTCFWIRIYPIFRHTRMAIFSGSGPLKKQRLQHPGLQCCLSTHRSRNFGQRPATGWFTIQSSCLKRYCLANYHRKARSPLIMSSHMWSIHFVVYLNFEPILLDVLRMENEMSGCETRRHIVFSSIGFPMSPKKWVYALSSRAGNWSSLQPWQCRSFSQFLGLFLGLQLVIPTH